MSSFDFTVDDSLQLYELEVQCNTGDHLEYENTIIEGLFFDELLWLTDISLIEETLDFSEDFTASHEPYCILGDALSFSEDFVTPTRVYGSFMSVVTKKEVTPVEIYWFGIDIVHGPDVFYQECIESLYFASNPTLANLFFDTIYESFWIDLEVPAGIATPYWLVSALSTTDLVNFRHEIFQEYYFNNVIEEALYPFDDLFYGYGRSVVEFIGVRDLSIYAHGRTVEESLLLEEACGSYWSGSMYAIDSISSIDDVIDERYYEYILEELVDVSDDFSINPSFSETIKSVLDISDDVDGFVAFLRTLAESLVLTSVSSHIYNIMEVTDETVDFSDSTGVDFIVSSLVSDAIVLIDTSSGTIQSDILALESLILYDEPLN